MIAELRAAADKLDDLGTLIEQWLPAEVAILDAARLLRGAAAASEKSASPPIPPAWLRLAAKAVEVRLVEPELLHAAAADLRAAAAESEAAQDKAT